MALEVVLGEVLKDKQLPSVRLSRFSVGGMLPSLAAICNMMQTKRKAICGLGLGITARGRLAMVGGATS